MSDVLCFFGAWPHSWNFPSPECPAHFRILGKDTSVSCLDLERCHLLTPNNISLTSFASNYLSNESALSSSIMLHPKLSYSSFQSSFFYRFEKSNIASMISFFLQCHFIFDHGDYSLKLATCWTHAIDELGVLELASPLAILIEMISSTYLLV